MSFNVKRYVAAYITIALGAAQAMAQMVVPAAVTPFGGGGGSVSSGSAISGCTINSIVYIDASGNLACALTPVNGSVSTAGRSIVTIRDTIGGGSLTDNFLTILGTLSSSASTTQYALNLTVASSGSASFNQFGALMNLQAGYTGSSSTAALNIINAAAGTNTTGGNGNSGVASVANATTSGFNYGMRGNALGSSAQNVGSQGMAMASTNTPTQNIGVLGLGGSATNNVAGYFLLGSSPPAGAAPTGNAAVLADNGSVAANIFEARDNGTATSTTAASANVTILDGAQMRLGNQVLTGSTMTPTIVGEVRTATHSYAWTNTMVTALGASLTGDINVAVLPAKTRVESVLVIIDSPDSSANALTVSCGDTGAGATNYVVAGDAKAAANTIYGDLISGAETGAALFDATSKWRRNYIPSYTATTTVSCRFTKTTTNLNTVTGSTGRVILTTTLLP